MGFVVLNITDGLFEADIKLQAGSRNTTYAVLMQQLSGSCPQTSDNGGTLTTDSTGRGHASTSVPRVPGATRFFLSSSPPDLGRLSSPATVSQPASKRNRSSPLAVRRSSLAEERRTAKGGMRARE